MKKRFFVLALVALPMAGFISCSDDDDDENNNSTQVESINVVSNVSENLGRVKHDCQWQYVHYSVDAAAGTLTIKVDSVAAKETQPEFVFKSISNDTCYLTLSYSRGYSMDTVYSASIVLNGFAKKNYTIIVNEADLYFSKYYKIAQVDMSKTSEGIFKGVSLINLLPDGESDGSDDSSADSLKSKCVPVLTPTGFLFPSENSDNLNAQDVPTLTGGCLFPSEE